MLEQRISLADSQVLKVFWALILSLFQANLLLCVVAAVADLLQEMLRILISLFKDPLVCVFCSYLVYSLLIIKGQRKTPIKNLN